MKGEKKDEGQACVKLGGGAGMRMGPIRYMVEERMGELLVGDGVHVLRETDERFLFPYGKNYLSITVSKDLSATLSHRVLRQVARSNPLFQTQSTIHTNSTSLLYVRIRIPL